MASIASYLAQVKPLTIAERYILCSVPINTRDRLAMQVRPLSSSLPPSLPPYLAQVKPLTIAELYILCSVPINTRDRLAMQVRPSLLPSLPPSW